MVLARDADITPASRLVLYDLEHGRGDIVPLSDLQDRTGLPTRTLRGALGELEEHGLAERRPDPRDGRRRAVELLVDDDQDDTDDISIPRQPSEA